MDFTRETILLYQWGACEYICVLTWSASTKLHICKPTLRLPYVMLGRKYLGGKYFNNGKNYIFNRRELLGSEILLYLSSSMVSKALQTGFLQLRIIKFNLSTLTAFQTPQHKERFQMTATVLQK